jgi:hypothetical protein
LEVPISTQPIITGKTNTNFKQTKLSNQIKFIMEKTSKVTNVAGIGTWNGQYGVMYKFEVSFENGDSGQYMSKSQEQTKFKVGQDATYTIEGKDFNGQTYYTVKPVMQQQAFGGGGKPAYQKDPETEKRITRMSVLKCATDLVINGEIKIHDLTKVATFLEHYVMTGVDSMTQIYGSATLEKVAKQVGGIEKNFMNDALDASKGNQDLSELPF